MSWHLGVSIHENELRAVLVRRGWIEWSADVWRAEGTSIAELIDELLSSLPRRKLGRLRATIAIGLGSCQVRQLEGLPAAKDERLLSRLARENSSSFFLRMGAGVVVTDVVRHGDGAAWAAAFEHTLVRDAIGALRAMGLKNVRAIPSIAALASILPAGTHTLDDDEGAIEVTTVAGPVIQRLRRVAVVEPSDRASLPSGLSELEADSWLYACAYGAAVSPIRAPFTWRPEPDANRTRRTMRIRLGLAASVLFMSATAAFMSPGIRAARLTRAAAREIVSLRETQIEAARVQGELKRANAILDRASEFASRRGKATLLVGALSQALPESTAIVSLRLDSLEGSFVALSPHVADVLPELVGVTDLISPRILGSVTKESLGNTQLERATIRFRRTAPPPAKTKPASGSRAGGA